MPWKPTGVALDTLAPHSLREVQVGGSSLLLVRGGAEVTALDPYCPHAGGVLSEGILEGNRLVCPVHSAVFDVTDGFVLEDPFGILPPAGGVEPLGHYPVRVVNGVVEVDLP
jgi:nitrite reductase/ring-hydroxylating ferredoxin subunit